MTDIDLERILSGGKNLVRTGWMQRGVPPSVGETVAQHSWEAGILAYYISKKLKEKGVNVSPEKAVTIAVFHDIGETLLGDLPKWATDRLPQKEEIEREAIKQLGLGEELFEEYKNKSLEGQIAKLSEMLATYLQARRYLRHGYDVKEIMETYFSVLQEMKRRSPFNLIEKQIDFLINDLIK